MKTKSMYRPIAALLVATLGSQWVASAYALPEAATTAGSGQTPSVDAGHAATATGQVSQGIALDLPPARLMPSLSLSYSSAGGDGDAGYGWSLGGPSRITRDLRREDPTLDVQDDHFVIDGASLVRPAGAPLSSLSFRRWGDAGLTEYSLDAETNVWTETTHSGLVRRYKPILVQTGTAPYAFGAQDAPAKKRRSEGTKAQADRSASDRTLVWALAQEEDVFGNFVEYFYAGTSAYATLTTQEMPALVEVRYGGNTRLGTKHPFVVQIGRYMHLVPSLLTNLAPSRAGEMQCENPLISDRPVSYRWGGKVVESSGQRIWGIGWAVADGSTTDATAFTASTALRGFMALSYNYDRVGCRNVNELHANLEKVERFGFDPQTGAAVPGPVTTYEYYGWDRQWSAVSHALPSGIGNSLPLARWSAAFPSLGTTMPSDANVMGSAFPAAAAGPYMGHWPSMTLENSTTGEATAECTGNALEGGTCTYRDQAAAPSGTQVLMDVNGDGLLDYVDFLAAAACSTTATQPGPLYAAGLPNGGFSSDLQPLPWADMIMRSNSSSGTQNAFCGSELSRGVVGSAYGTAAAPAPMLGISGNEAFQIDLDANGYPDVMRLIGPTNLWSSKLGEGLGTGLTHAWHEYYQAPDHSYRAPEIQLGVPWSVGGTTTAGLLRRAAMLNVSTTGRTWASEADEGAWDVDGLGFDYSSTELGSVVDLTGDGVPDRLGSMKLPRLSNQPATDGLVRENWALVLYRGTLAIEESGQYHLTFATTPEVWWTRAEGGLGLDGSEDADQLAPATSATLTWRCYGQGQTACESHAIGVDSLVDVNGDGLLDIVTARPKLNEFYRVHQYVQAPPRGGGSYQLHPVSVLYNTGRGFHYAPFNGTMPHYLSHSAMWPMADHTATEGVQTEETLEQLLDFNGDGLVDLVQPHGVRINGGGEKAFSEPLSVTMPSSGGGFEEQSIVARAFINSDWHDVRGQVLKIADMNADGRPDLVYLDQATRQYTLYTDADLSQAPGRLKAVHNGLGATTSYAYQTVAQALNGTQGAPHKGFVLESVHSTAGSGWSSGGERATHFYYRNAQFARPSEGRDDGELAAQAAAFLGFQEVSTVSPTGQVVTDTYSYEFGKEGQLVKEEVHPSWSYSQLLSRTTHTYRGLHLHSRSVPSTLPHVQPVDDVYLPDSVTTETWHEMSRWFYNPTPTVTRTRYIYPEDTLQNLGLPSVVLNEGDVDDPRDDVEVETQYEKGTFSDVRGTFKTIVPKSTVTRVYSDMTAAVDRIAGHVENEYDCNPSVIGPGAGSCLSSTVTRGLVGRSSVFYSEDWPFDWSKTLQTKYYYTSENDGLLRHTVSPEGRIASVCYDARHLYPVISRGPAGQRTETVFDIATGAAIELRGPVGLSSMPLEGAPGVGMNAMPCPAVDMGEPGFGGMPPTIRTWPVSQAMNTPEVQSELRPTPPGASEATPATTPPYRSDVIPYSTYDDPAAVALRERRASPVPGSEALLSMRLAWQITEDTWPLPSLAPTWPALAPTFTSRTLTTPTARVEYDGIGRILSSYATATRNLDGTYAATQLSSHAQWFGDGVTSWPEGVMDSYQTLVSGDDWWSANAVKHNETVGADGAGQRLWQNRQVGASYVGTWQSYGIRGNVEYAFDWDPQAAWSMVMTGSYDFDDLDRLRSSWHSAGRAARADYEFSWQTDGPHFVSRNSGGGFWWAGTRLGETEVIPRERTVISRAYIDELTNNAIVTKAVADETGRTKYVVNPEGQVTSYLYDLAGRPLYVGRFNSLADYMNGTPLEETDVVYPDLGDTSSPTEDYRTTVSSYRPDGSHVSAIADTHLDRATGRVVSTERSMSTDTESRIGEGATTYTYVTDSNRDGFGQVDTVTAPNETSVFSYNGQQLASRTERQFEVAWPGTTTILTDWVVYHTDYEPTGLVRRTAIDTSEGRMVLNRFEYNEGGNLVALYDEMDSVSTPAETYEYNYLGMPWRRHDPRGGTRTIEYDHYGAPRVATLESTELGGSGVLAQTLTHDPMTGFPLSIATNRPDGTTALASYKYNLAGQLTEATDTEGTSLYQANISYRCASGVCGQRYDQIDEFLPLSGMRRLHYNYNDAYDVTQLASLTDPDTSAAIRSYGYDPTGALQTDGTVTHHNDPFGEERHHGNGGYLYAGGAQTFQYVKAPGESTPGTVYAALPGLDIEYARSEGGALVHHALRTYVGSKRIDHVGPNAGETAIVDGDALGNASVVRKLSSGLWPTTTVAYASYTPFGETILDRTSPGFGSEWFGYKGGRVDKTGASDGTVRFGARSYDPVSKQWTSRDPIRAGLNEGAYGAFGQNPVAMSDPSGLTKETNTETDRVKAGIITQYNIDQSNHSLTDLWQRIGPARFTPADAARADAEPPNDPGLSDGVEHGLTGIPGEAACDPRTHLGPAYWFGVGAGSYVNAMAESTLNIPAPRFQLRNRSLSSAAPRSRAQRSPLVIQTGVRAGAAGSGFGGGGGNLGAGSPDPLRPRVAPTPRDAATTRAYWRMTACTGGDCRVRSLALQSLLAADGVPASVSYFMPTIPVPRDRRVFFVPNPSAEGGLDLWRFHAMVVVDVPGATRPLYLDPLRQSYYWGPEASAVEGVFQRSYSPSAGMWSATPLGLSDERGPRYGTHPGEGRGVMPSRVVDWLLGRADSPF